MNRFKEGDTITNIKHSQFMAYVYKVSNSKLVIDLFGNHSTTELKSREFKFWRVSGRIDCKHKFIELDNEGVFSSEFCKHCGKEVRK